MATNGSFTDIKFDNPSYGIRDSTQKLYLKDEGLESLPGNKKGGCFVSTRNALILLFCALAVAAIVGILVFFLHPDKGKIEATPTVPSQTSSTTTATTTSTKAPPVDVRLSGDLIPDLYELRLRPDIYGGDPAKFRFTGDVKITFNVQRQLDKIEIHTKQLAVPEAKINVRKKTDNSRLDVLDTYFELDKEFFHINLAKTLQPGQTYTVYIEFSGNVSNDLAGIYYSTYMDGEQNEEYLLTSQLQATDARKVFPCFDEPAMKAKFKVSMERKKGFVTMSNTEITTTDPLSGDWEVDHYSESPKMSTYLLAFMVSKFECIEDQTARGTVVEVCARPNAISHAEYALSVAVPMQEYFEWYHDIPYPLPKMTHVAVPDFAAGAMENWGLVLYRETALLYDSKTTSASSKQWVTIVIAHELAHMWFGNLVTPDWWDDIWLNEGFASWMEITCTENITNSWQMERQFAVDDMQYVMRLDGLASSHPVYQPVNHPSEIDALFDTITYSKGASVIRMMQHFLGDEVFRLGLSNYLKDRSYQAANHDDLFHALTKEAQNAGQNNLNVTAVMYTWIRQMGYPVVHVTYNKVNGHVGLEQKHFLLDPSKKEDVPESPYGYIWDVPVTLYAQSGAAKLSAASDDPPIHWLKTKEGTILGGVPSSADWILANVKQQYYYRVNYEKDMWDALIRQLTDDHTGIPFIENRAQIIDDAFALGRAGEIDQLVGLRTTEYLDKEMEYVPWVAAVDNMAYLDSMLELSPSYAQLRKYMQKKTEPHHNRLGWNDDVLNDPHVEQRMRRLIIGQACYYGLEGCVRGATGAFSRWMTDPVKNTVSANLQSVVFCNGIRYGGGAEWDFVYEKYKTSGTAEEQDTFLRALACTRQADLLNSYLQKALDLEIRRQDFRTVIVGVSRNPNGRALAWNFLRANWDKIYEMFGASSFTLGRIISGLTGSFSTEWELTELMAFKASLAEVGSAVYAFEQAVETVNINIAWRTAHEQSIATWLTEKSGGTEGPVLPTDVRLDGNVIPSAYDVKIRPDFYGTDPMTFSFSGSVGILFRVVNDTIKLTLHYKKLTIDEASISIMQWHSTDTVSVVSTRYEPEKDFYHVTFDQPLTAGSDYGIMMDFTGPLTNDLAGIYLSSYVDDNGDTQYLVSSQLQATDARKVFPCLDEPALKATFNVTIERMGDFVTFGNTEIDTTTDLPDGWKADHYKMSPKMSTYLLAFVVSKFPCKNTMTTTGTKVELCARPELIDQVDYALGFADDMQVFFEDFHNISIPLTKMAHVAVPDFAAGAMENWGLILYREYALLYDPQSTDVRYKQYLTYVVAHELAHQWFGNLVTPSWWDDIWLNEGFASWMQILCTDASFPSWRMEAQFIISDLQRVMALDGLASSHPVYQPVNNPAEIDALFDAITYSKGATVIRMMKHFLGDDVFRWGLSKYLKERAYDVATHDELFQTLTEVAKDYGKQINVTKVMYTWIRQMGYPVIHASYDETTGKVSLSQKHFLLDPSKESEKPASPYGYIWDVPMTVVTDLHQSDDWEGMTPSWFTTSSGEVSTTVNAKWIMLNPGVPYYYRTNYDPIMWDNLIAQLLEDHEKIVMQENRAQLLDDSFNLGRAGEIDQLIGLRMTEYLDKEMEYVPWYSALANMGYINDMLELSSSYSNLRKYMRMKTEPLHTRLGWADDVINDPHLEQRLRYTLIGSACFNELPACVSEATKQFSRWMEDPVRNKVSPNLQSVVYCNGVRYGGSAEWDFVLSRYKVASSAAQAATFIRAMACTKHPDLLYSYLQRALDEEIRRGDFSSVISSVANNPTGRSLAWNFLRANWDAIYDKYGDSTFAFGNIISGVTASFSTQFELDELISFKSSVPSLGSAVFAFDQAIEKVAINIAWRAQNELKISDWLKNNTEGTKGPALPTDVRLDGNVIPSAYDVKIRPDFYGSDPMTFSFSGSVGILFRVVNDTIKLTLHYKKLTIDEASISIMQWHSTDTVNVVSTRYEPEKDFYHVTFDQPLTAGSDYGIMMDFTGPLTNDLAGIYLSSYVDDNGDTQYLVSSQLQATDARKVFPCLDEPALKATFNVTIERMGDFVTFGNTEIDTTTDLPDGWKADHYKISPKMSTYLLAFMVSKFPCKNTMTTTGTKVELCARPELIDQVDYALDFADDMQVFFEDYHNISIPLTKMAHVAVPDFAAGAMENWGLILYREYALLYDPQSTDVRYKQYLTYVVAHELAHQWFGNLVTPSWWDDIWLNEGFASWMEILCTDASFPSWRMEAQFIISDLQRVMALDGLASSHPVYQPVNNPAEIDALFDAITYSKGATVIRMMKHFLGDDVFRWGLSKYLKERAYDVATHDDLFQTLTEVAKDYGKQINVTKVMYTWIRQMGYPVIHASYDVKTGKVSLSQKHFLLDPSKESEKPASPFGYIWDVPMTVVTDLHPSANWAGMTPSWFTSTSGEVITNPNAKWIMLNPGVPYYYRTNYDPIMWENIIAQLLEDHEKIVMQENRAQLLDDSFNLGRAGEIDQLIGLRMTEYLDKEMEYVPWYSALANMGYINDMLELSSSYSNLRKYMRMKTEPLHTRLGWADDVINDPHLEQRLRYTLIGSACFNELPACVSEATKQFSRWMEDPVRNKVSPNLQSVVYCNGVRYGGSAEWDFVLSRYKVASSAAQAATFIRAMACTKHPDLLYSYLQRALDEEIRRGDFSSVISSVANNPTGRSLAWNFLRANWDAIYDKYGDSTFAFGNIISGVTASFSTQFELDELISFKSSVPSLGSAVFAFDQAIEKVAINIAWRAQNELKISDWLKNNTEGTEGPALPTDVRLDGNVIPSAYDVKIRPDFYGTDPMTFSFSGSVGILFRVVNDTIKLTLHYKKLTIDEASISIMQWHSTDTVNVVSTRYEPEKDFYHVTFDQPLTAGSDYGIMMDFTGPLTNDLAGIYLSSYVDDNGDTQYLVTSQLQATDARKVFPCLDEPALKATFNVTIERMSDFVTFGNTEIDTTTDLPDGWKADHFKMSPKMSTYLLAFMVSKFPCKNTMTTTGTKVELCARPELIDQVDYALGFADDMQVFFEDYHNISIPLTKMAHVAVPDFAAGAMENWGLILYREYALLYDPQSTDVRYKQYLTYVVAHELAHQWFGNLVTPSWWDDIWLNEGFASWMEILCTDASFPSWRMEAQFIISDLQRVMALDGLASSHPVYQPVNNPAEIDALFDAITYSKGATVIRMMKHFLGDDVFRWGLSKYLKERAYDVATHDDLFQTLTEVAKDYGKQINVTKVMYTWIRQMGYPVIHASYDVTTGKVSLSQKHFLLDPSKESEKPASPFGYIWDVPMTVVTDLHPSANWAGMTPSWFTSTSGEVITNPNAKWIMLNPGVPYYYRTNYDPIMWDNIIAQLLEDHEKIVMQENRAQLLDDSFNLGRAGEIDQLIGLRMTEYLDKEMEYVPWYSALANMGYINDMLELSSSYSNLRKYMRMKTEPLHTRLGWADDVINDPHLEQRLRYTLIGSACFNELPACVSEATKQFSRWMEDPVRNKVSPNLQSVVYCNGVRYGGSAEWDFVLSRYKVASSAAQAATFIRAMACTKHSDLLYSYLQRALDEEIRRGDFSSVISSVANNPTGRSLAWNFLRANWDAIYDKYGDSTFAFGNIITGVTASFSTQFELDELISFKSSVPSLGSAVFAFDQAIEKVAINIAWREQNEQKISDWLKNNTGDTGIGERIDVRLPKTLAPIHYMVQIRPNIYTGSPETFGFNGTAIIQIEVLDASDTITLHSRSLQMRDEDWVVMDMNMNNIQVTSVNYDEAREFYLLTLKNPLVKGQNYFVHVSYTGPVDDTLVGIYWSSYQDGNKTEYLLASQLQATHARKVFPCFDEPGIKARFNITIEYRKDDGFTTKGNTDIYKTEQLDDGWWADHYTPTPEMSTYLLGFLVSKFECLQNTTNNGVTVEICARPNAIDQAKFANTFSNNMQEHYVDVFNISYPLPRMSHIGLPDFAFGAMENWGLIMYREARVLYDPDSGTAGNRQTVSVIIAHELAHQWFGNLVTPDWWDDLWLNEGFATWVSVACASSSFPDMQLEEQFVIQRLQPVMRLDGLVTSHPVYQTVNDPGEIDALFDSITYSKGASVNRMMQYFLGDAIFKAGLSAYLKEQSYKAAFHDQLFGTLTRVAKDEFGKNINVTAVMNTWIRQMGYPVVMVDYDRSTGAVSLSQKHFLLDPTKEGDRPQSAYGYLWEVPFTCVTDKDSDNAWNEPTITWFNTAFVNKTCTSSGDWILGNVGQRMYYRINYPVGNWDNLINALNNNPEDIKSIANRAQVIDDSFNLGRSGDLDQLVAMRVTEYLDKEMEFVPWQAAVDNLDYVNNMFQLSSSYGYLRKYMQMKTAIHHDRLGWTSMNDAPHTQQLLRTVMIGTACSFGVESCLNNATTLFAQWMADVQDGKPSSIHSDVRSAVYCYGIASAGAAEWEFVLAQYKTADSALEADTLLKSLACTGQAYLLNSFLERALNAEIRLQDFSAVIVSVSEGAVGRSLAWNFFRANWNEIRAKFGDSPFTLSRMVAGITAKFSTEFELTELRDFKNSVPDAGSAVFAFEQAIESTSINIAWRQKNEQLITDWLKQKI